MTGNSVAAWLKHHCSMTNRRPRGPPVYETETHATKHTCDGINTADEMAGYSYCDLHHVTDAIPVRQSNTSFNKNIDLLISVTVLCFLSYTVCVCLCLTA